MRLLLVHGTATDGSGSGRYILDLTERFAEDGHDVTLCCHECEPRIEGRAGLRVVKIPRPTGRFSTWRLGHVWHFRGLQRTLPSVFRGERFDALIGSDLLFIDTICRHFGPDLAFVYTPLSMIAPIEIESYRMDALRSFLGVRLFRTLQRRALERCQRVVRFTESGLRALEHYYGMDLQNKKLVSVYLSREFDQPASASTDPPPFERPSPKELLWVGRLISSKNVAFLLRAASRLQSRDWVLTICNDGPQRASLEALSRELGIASRVNFAGHVQDLAAVYRRAAMLLTASVLEQYSLTVMEACAFGIPCVGLKPDGRTTFNANEDQIIDEVTGFIVRNEEEMARRIDQLLSDESLRQRMGREAYARKQSGFSFETYYREISEATVSAVASLARRS